MYYIKILFEVHFKIQDGTIRDGLNLLSLQCFLRALQLKKHYTKTDKIKDVLA